MFHVHGMQGRVYSGTLEQLRQQQFPVTGVRSVRRLAPTLGEPDSPAAAPAGGAASHPRGHDVAQAYGQAHRTREPLRTVADVMRRPAFTVPAEATLREAWQALAGHGIAQAPVLNREGVLVGLIGRAELMPPSSLEPPDLAAERERLSQPVTAFMWSPVPSAAPDTDLRRVAALLLDTGLPGVPVAAEDGQVLGFVSRTDLLRALATDPPLDLWG
ncbi:MAG TPA: CBS domain-containing protein [Rhizobacter sp.]